MGKLIVIDGWCENEAQLQNFHPEPGQTLVVNVLDNPFRTFMSSSEDDLGELPELTTDIIKHFNTFMELEDSVKKPADGDVYITGEVAPYTRYKAYVRGTEVKWEEDGVSELLVMDHCETKGVFTKKRYPIEDGVYYSVGKKAPYKLFGHITSWEDCGAYISEVADALFAGNANEGEVWMIQGDLYLKLETGWRYLDAVKPIRNIYHQTFTDKRRKYRIREGLQLGTFEFYPLKDEVKKDGNNTL